MKRFDWLALAWAVLLCLMFAGAIPGVIVVVMFPALWVLAVFVLGFIRGVSLELLVQLRGRR